MGEASYFWYKASALAFKRRIWEDVSLSTLLSNGYCVTIFSIPTEIRYSLYSRLNVIIDNVIVAYVTPFTSLSIRIMNALCFLLEILWMTATVGLFSLWGISRLKYEQWVLCYFYKSFIFWLTIMNPDVWISYFCQQCVRKLEMGHLSMITSNVSLCDAVKRCWVARTCSDFFRNMHYYFFHNLSIMMQGSYIMTRNDHLKSPQSKYDKNDNCLS